MQTQTDLLVAEPLVQRTPGAALAYFDSAEVALEPGLTLLPKLTDNGDRIVIELIASALAR